MSFPRRAWRLPAIAVLALLTTSPLQLPRLSLPRLGADQVAAAGSAVATAVPAAPVPALPTIAAPTPELRPLPATSRDTRPQAPVPPPPAPTPAPRLPAPPPQLPQQPGDFPRGRYHLVQPGQTAAQIAAAYGLAGRWTVYDANPFLVRPSALRPGQWLFLPHPTMTPQRRPRPGEAGWSPTPINQIIVDSVWLSLAACESSGDWAINTGNSFYGGLQFTLDSWRLVGGRGKPHEAHPMEQIARADALQRIQGWKAWPVCSVKLGLRAPDPTPSPTPAGPQQ